MFVAERGGRIVGTYYLRANNRGGGAHVANCGYMVAPDAMGGGVARAMCAHSLDEARARGFTAMQFNFVIASNERAVKLWQAWVSPSSAPCPALSCTQRAARSTPTSCSGRL